ncbi:hypothetical protein [Arsenicibacter rosenii]|uniref:Tetratricopeptide repeat protein n=1 Tax=Arsenicibacter rosenii TaxID=1750698 RepID=A0A1S2VQM7_9BACT|nr:hypothetical protein [Arsenicibacter rosenii]OIN60098.1 hypothetical protein BLX24_04415 [Arsenicibacter rosenii]
MSLLFWKTWSRSYRILYLLSLLLLLAAVVAFCLVWWRGLANMIRWDVLSELLDLPATIYTFSDGLLDFPVRGKTYAVSEQFVASAMTIAPWMATVLLTGVCIAMTMVLSALTRLPRLKYFIGMGIFLVALSTFRFEMLAVPGFDGLGADSRYLFLVIAFLLISLSYYFHAFRPDVLMPVRLAVFGGLIAAIAGVLGYFAQTPFPALTTISYGMPALLVLAMGFIFFISAEIVAGLVWLTSANFSGNTDVAEKRILGFNNLIYISLLYLVNLLLIALRNTKVIDWDLLAISPFVIYLLSALVGIWGFRRLTEQQASFSFGESGAFLYAGLALLSTLTIAYLFGTANDPLIEAFEDIIVYSHLVMCVLFLVYVGINFLPIYEQGLPVHRVLYKPKRLELSLFRVMGVFAVFAIIGLQDFFPFRQSVAGYYNGLGDLYIATGELASARAFYQQALEHEFQNHKSNYSMASLAVTDEDRPTAAYYFSQALLKQPSPQAYASLSQTYLQNSLFFEAVKILQRGIKAFPQSGELRNNLGFLYARTSVADSAYFYFDTATKTSKQPDVPKSNLLALYVKNPQVLAADSSLANTEPITYESYQANALALRLVARRDTSLPEAPAWLSAGQTDMGLSVGRFASLYNYALSAARPVHNLTNTIRKALERPDNQDFTDDLLFARAMAEYHNHQPLTAFSLIGQLAEGTSVRKPNALNYQSILGLLMIDQQLYRSAAEQFQMNTDTVSLYYQAIAYTKAGDLPLAQSRWEAAARRDSTVTAIKQVLYDERPPQTDIERAFYVVYRTDDLNRGKLWEQISTPDLKAVAGKSLIDRYIASKQWFYAQMILSQLPKPDRLGAYARSVENVLALRLAVARRNGNAAIALAKEPMLPDHAADRAFYLAQAYVLKKNPAQAQNWFNQALTLAPLRADIVTGVARFRSQQKQVQSAYKALVAALPFNRDQPELLKTYIDLCLTMGLRDYAATELAQLQQTTTPADYQAFLAAYQEKLALIEKSNEKFGQ